MKNLKIYLLVSFAALSSCGKFLDVIPDGVATIENAFTSRTTAEKYLFTCYSYLPAFSSHDNNIFFAGDEFWVPFPQTNFFTSLTFEQLARGNQSMISPRLNFWDGTNGGKPMFRALRDCNIFLENIVDVPGMQEHEKRRWIAEVKFLKAYYHFWLLRMYGPIPIIRENLSVSSDVETVQVKREPVDDCFSYIVQLLDEAADDLPVTINDEYAELGRITRVIALSIKAQVLIQAASPLYNGNNDYAAFHNQDGQALFSSAFDIEKWQKAAAAAKVAIDLCHEANLKLYTFNVATIPQKISDTTRIQMSIRNAVTERWNSEVIWATAPNGGTTYLQYIASAKWDPERTQSGVGALMAPPLHIAEMFYSDNGVPINEDLTWDYSNRYSIQQATVNERYNIRVGYETAQLNFDRENRFYASLGFDGGVWFGQRNFNDNNPFYLQAKVGQLAGKAGISGFSTTGYYTKKIVHYQTVLGVGNANANFVDYAWPIMRLADLYLMYAEALNEYEGPSADVFHYINLVRERSGLKGVEEAWSLYSNRPTKFTAKDGMREIIQQERLIELAFEGHRFWDIRRWKRGQEFFNRNIQGWDVDQEETSLYYRVRTVFTKRFSLKDYLWPISEDNLIKNKNLVQNPGW